MSRQIVFLLLWAAPLAGFAQTPRTDVDTRETLEWVQRQAERIEKTLLDAVISQDPMNMVFKLFWAWREFDAVAQAGVYCHAARAAAEKGRTECDLLSYDRKQDMSSMVLRATEARGAAYRMRQSAENCLTENEQSVPVEVGFAPRDVLYRDAVMVELDLTDAKASRDFHILAQKLEHAMRVLRDAEYLAGTLDNCTDALIAARAALSACREALVSNQWDTVTQHIRAALEQTQLLKSGAANCR